MKIPKTNCPRCNALQAFAPKKRVALGKIETYIACNVCRTETVLDSKTVAEVRARRKEIRRRNQEIRRHGN